MLKVFKRLIVVLLVLFFVRVIFVLAASDGTEMSELPVATGLTKTATAWVVISGQLYQTTLDDVLDLIESGHLPDLSAIYLTLSTYDAGANGKVDDADAITATDSGDANATWYPTLFDGATGTQQAQTDQGLYFNPQSNLLYSAGGVSSAPTDDPVLSFVPSTSGESAIYLGINNDSGGDDDDPFEIRDSMTPGTDVRMSITKEGSVLGGINFSTKSGAYTVGTDNPQEINGTVFLATGAADLTLDAIAGASGCLMQGQGNTSALTINPGSGNYFVTDGIRGTVATDFASSGAAGDRICWACYDGTDIYITSHVGTWSE
jgi:hypothetical protein